MQQFFIDHTHKRTSYMDPRVPTEPLFPRRTSDDNSGVSVAWEFVVDFIEYNIFTFFHSKKCLLYLAQNET